MLRKFAATSAVAASTAVFAYSTTFPTSSNSNSNSPSTSAFNSFVRLSTPSTTLCDPNSEPNSDSNSSSSDSQYYKPQYPPSSSPPPSERRKKDSPQPHFPYVIVGAGTTAHAAIEAIKIADPTSTVLLISSESVLPSLHRGDTYGNNETGVVEVGDDLLSSYNEWRRHISSKLETEPDAYSSVDGAQINRRNGSGGAKKEGKVCLLLRNKDVKIDKENKIVVLQNGSKVSFDKLLLATAGTPRAFYVLDLKKSGLSEQVNTLNSLQDFERLEQVIPSLLLSAPSTPKNIVVVGGGFLGTEVALAMASRASAQMKANPGGPMIQVSQIYAERAPLESYLPKYLADDMKTRLKQHGVEPISDRLVTDLKPVSPPRSSFASPNAGWEDDTNGAEGSMGKFKINLVGVTREQLDADYIILASSTIMPNTQVAVNSNLEIDTINGGIICNDNFEVGNGVYAAGVVASYYDGVLGRRRVNRYDHSINSGLVAGYNMVSSNSRRLTSRSSDNENSDNTRNSENSEIEESTFQLEVAERGAGKQMAYVHQPAVRSNLSDINVECESVGECSSEMETVGVWIDSKFGDQFNIPADENASGSTGSSGSTSEDETDTSIKPNALPLPKSQQLQLLSDVSCRSPYRRGAIYYIKGNRIVGIVLWNASDLLERARDVVRLQADIKSFADIEHELKKKIPLAPDAWLMTRRERKKEKGSGSGVVVRRRKE